MGSKNVFFVKSVQFSIIRRKEIKGGYIMKYKDHIIIKVKSDLGEEKNKLNVLYEISKDGKYINTALTLSTAKEFIDSGYNETYL